jgi:hypothetical protein
LFSFLIQRFGAHRCIEAVKDIKKGNEIFVNYEYMDLHAFGLPDWYRKLFIETFPERAHEAVMYNYDSKEYSS